MGWEDGGGFGVGFVKHSTGISTLGWGSFLSLDGLDPRYRFGHTLFSKNMPMWEGKSR